jgi:hypothetical protein
MPIKFLRFDPGDRLQTTHAGEIQIYFLERTEFGVSGLIEFEATLDDTDTLKSTATGIFAPADQSRGLITVPPPTDLFLMDLPLLRDVDDGAGYYMAAAGAKSWIGAQIFRSLDGQDFANFEAFVANENSIVGYAVTALADAVATIFDETNTVDVRLINSDFTLLSKTELQVLNGVNVALLGGEIIQWKTATALGDNKFRLSGLHRGRRGTDFAIATHKIGEAFVVLDTDTTKRIAAGSSEIGLTRFFKEVSLGSDFDDVTVTAFANAAVGLKPYSPVQVKATRDGPGNITITWIRRTRVGGEWRDLVDAPLSEASESYEVDIFDNDSSGNPFVVRTLKPITSETVVYTTADQVTDFGSNQASVDIEAFQISAVVGRGFGRKATV